MQSRDFFMRDQVRDRVSDIMRETRLPELGGEVGGSILTLVVVVLTVLNVLAVAPGA